MCGRVRSNRAAGGLALSFQSESEPRVAGLKSANRIVVKEIKRTPTEADILLEVSHKLQQAHQAAQLSCDKVLLYFIDMAISHVGELLRSRLDLNFESAKSA